MELETKINGEETNIKEGIINHLSRIQTLAACKEMIISGQVITITMVANKASITISITNQPMEETKCSKIMDK